MIFKEDGSIPAPTLYYTEGDTTEIWVFNELQNETSIHWHGLILPNTEIPDSNNARKKLYSDNRMLHFMTSVGIESNLSDGEAMFANTRWIAGTEWHLGVNRHYGYESESYVGRYIGKMQWLLPFAGFDIITITV